MKKKFTPVDAVEVVMSECYGMEGDPMGPHDTLANMIGKERSDVYKAMAWSRLWKRAAKMWWIYAKDNEQGMIERERLWRDAQARADSRLELLREILDEVFPDDEYWPELFSRELIDRIAKELANDNA